MKITWSLFPKFYKHLSAVELAELVQKVGLDTTGVIIRDGYPVTHDNLAAALPAFLKELRAAGLTVNWATAGFMPAPLVEDPTPLTILADNGITEYRMGHFWYDGPDVRGVLADVRREMETLAPVLERHGIKCVYQLHHFSLVASATGAYELVKDLPAEHFGVMLDPGNQAHDGWEHWHRSARLLREYLCAVGVKDVCPTRDPAKADEPKKGWQQLWCPIYEGITEWRALALALAEIDFRGTFVFMPFYDEGNPEAMTAKLAREVAWLRESVSTATAGDS